MRGCVRIFLLVVLLCGASTGAWAQSRELTVRALRVSARGMNEGERLRVRGVYAAPSGLREASRFYFRNKGYSRFSLRDLEADVWFGSLYCESDSDVARQLLSISTDKVVVLEGARGRGEDMEPAIFVSSVRVLGDPVDPGVEEAEAPPAATPSTAVVTVPPGVSEVSVQPQGNTFRIKIIDSSNNATSILSNVELDKPYRTFGTTIILERE